MSLETCSSLTEILVLVGTAGAGRMAPLVSTRVPAKLKRVQDDKEHSSRVHLGRGGGSHVEREGGVDVVRPHALLAHAARLAATRTHRHMK